MGKTSHHSPQPSSPQQQPWPQQIWEGLLGTALLVVAALMAVPMLFPRPRVPSVTREHTPLPNSPTNTVNSTNTPTNNANNANAASTSVAQSIASTQPATPQPTTQSATPTPQPTQPAQPVQPQAPEYPRTTSVEPLISGKVNLNTATLEQLEALPKIGTIMAQRIIDARPFRSWQDFDDVKGIGTATLKQLKPLVTW